jgi:2'-5' RNA ligase
MRWTTAEQWHVTLRFLGSVVDEAAVAQALTVVPEMARRRGVSSVTATLGPSSAWFPGRRVLYVPVGGLDDLAAVVADVTAAWGPAEASVSPGPYRGHLTLGRARGDAQGPASAAGALVSATWPVDTVLLMSSTLGRGGARYRAEAAVPLFDAPRV